MINKLVEKIKKTGAPIVVGLSMARHWKAQQMPSGSTTNRLSTVPTI